MKKNELEKRIKEKEDKEKQLDKLIKEKEETLEEIKRKKRIEELKERENFLFEELETIEAIKKIYASKGVLFNKATFNFASLTCRRQELFSYLEIFLKILGLLRIKKKEEIKSLSFRRWVGNFFLVGLFWRWAKWKAYESFVREVADVVLAEMERTLKETIYLLKKDIRVLERRINILKEMKNTWDKQKEIPFPLEKVKSFLNKFMVDIDKPFPELEEAKEIIDTILENYREMEKLHEDADYMSDDILNEIGSPLAFYRNLEVIIRKIPKAFEDLEQRREDLEETLSEIETLRKELKEEAPLAEIVTGLKQIIPLAGVVAKKTI